MKNTTYSYFLLESHRQQILLVVWTLGMLYAYALNNTRSVPFVVGEKIFVECTPQWKDHSNLQRLALASVNLLFTCIIPSILMIYTYRFIQIKVKRNMKNGNVAYAVNFNPATNGTSLVAKVIQVKVTLTVSSRNLKLIFMNLLQPPKCKIIVRRHYKEVSLDDRQRVS